MIRFRPFLAMAVSALVCAGTAAAHVGFLLPDTFSPEAGQKVTVIASFSAKFPQAEIALKSDGFALVSPDGQVQPLESAALPSRSVLTVTPDGPGTYRITTGERLGRKGEIALVDGAYVRIGEGGIAREDVPDGAKILSSQTATVSDVYISVAGEGPAGIPETEGRLQLALAERPDAVVTGVPVEVSVGFEGDPLSGVEVSLNKAYDHYTNPDGIAYQADDGGRVLLPGLEPGTYVLLVRHIAPSPDGAETDVRSYTTTLTFEVKATSAEN